MSAKTIAQIMREYLDSNGIIIRSDSYRGRDFLRLLSVLDGTAKNFTVFYNAGGRHFHIWFLEDMSDSDKFDTKAFEAWILSDKGHHYMYSIEGREVILMQL